MSSTRARLNRIQRRSVSNDNHDIAMASIIGTIDGLFWPHMFTDWRKFNLNAVIYRNQRLYHEKGVEWKGLAEGRNAASWKSNQRLRDSLAETGRIKITRTSGTPLVKPTNMGRERAKLGLPTVRSPSTFYMYIKVLLAAMHGGSIDEEHPLAPRDSGWCIECWIADSTYDEKPMRGDWFHFQDVMLPLLVAGLVECKQTTIGHLCYRAICEEQDDPNEDTTYYESAAEVHEEIDKTYFDAWETQQALNLTGDPGHEIWIPLPATSF